MVSTRRGGLGHSVFPWFYEWRACAFFPEGLSADSVADLEGYIEILLRKLRREAGKEAAN